MKKIILILAAIGFITIAATTKIPPIPNDEVNTGKTAKYKACIEACNTSVVYCKNCERICAKSKDASMVRCIQLCKECVAICTATSQLITLDSTNVVNICTECAKICNECATECEKFTTKPCAECDNACHKAAKLCNDI